MSVPRLVCDTNVVVSGLMWHGAPRRVLTRIQAGAALGYTCVELLEEVRHVLLYRKIARVLEHAELTHDDILTGLAAHFTTVACSPLPSAVITADPSDDIVLACAHAAHADVIISGDRHLLQLKRYASIPIVSASAWLRLQ